MTPDPPEALVRWLEQALGYRFNDPGLIDAALTHRSAGGVSTNNERLEFLGDGVLNFVVASLLYRQYPHAKEGELSRLRSSLVKGVTLATLAGEIGVGERLRLGTGEMRSGGYRRESILADALEAIFGAIYVDGGFDAARAAIERLMQPRMAQLPAVSELKDPKTRLQEFLQGRGLAIPVYKVESVVGEPHDQIFTVRCEVKAFGLTCHGRGSTRRGAEQEAATEALPLALERAKLEDESP